MTHLTAERRVRAVFYWAHVLAINASVVKDPIKLAAQRAVSTLQLILIAVRGHRAYTSSELDVIFKGVGQQFFMALEEIAQHHEQTEYDRRFEMHRKDPDKHTLPAPFQKTERSVTIVVYVNAFVSSTSTVFHVNVICVGCIRQISYVVYVGMPTELTHSQRTRTSVGAVSAYLSTVGKDYLMLWYIRGSLSKLMDIMELAVRALVKRVTKVTSKVLLSSQESTVTETTRRKVC